MKRLLLVLLLCGSISAQQRTAPTPAAPEPAAIDGIVINQVTNAPISGAVVTLVLESGSSHTANSGIDGKFSIGGLAAGRYRVMLARTGYVQPRRSAGTASPVNLSFAAGQHLQNIRFQLAPTAAITGRVLDSNGNPSKDSSVYWLRYEYRFGRRVLIQQSTLPARVDGSGEYRLFGLEAGEYIVAVFEDGLLGRYYPGVSDTGDAIPIVVQAGAEIPAVDIRLTPRRLHTVRFKFVESNPEQARHRTVRLIRLERNRIEVGVSGTFSKMDAETYVSNGLSPGSYRIYLELNAGASIGRLSFDITDHDVDAGTLTVLPAVPVAGRILVAGQLEGQPIPQNLQLRLQPMDTGFGLAVAQLARIAPDGTFHFESINGSAVGRSAYAGVIPGPHQIELPGLPRDYYVSSARYGGSDILVKGLEVTANAAAPLEITISSSAGSLEGVVENSEREPLGDSTVVLIPAQARRQHFESFKTAASDQYGKFSIRGIAPGDYMVLAWEDVEPGASLNEDFLKSVETHAARVTVLAGSSLNMAVRVQPRQALR